MNRAQAREVARGMLRDYLEGKGINTRRAFSCLNPEHYDANPSMSFDVKHNRVKCFSCGESYDIFDLVGMDYGLTDQREIFDKTYELLGLTVENEPRRERPEDVFSDLSEEEEKGQLSGNNQEINRKKTGSNQEIPRQSSANNPDIIRQSSGQKQDKSGQYTHTHTDVYKAEEEDRLPYYEACRKRLHETEYPASRGLSSVILNRHMIGYDPDFKTRSSAGELVTWKALIIPTGRGSYQARNTDPSAGHKDRYRKRGEAHIFGYKALYTSASPVFVVEGEIDCMSIEEAGGAAIGLGSFDNVPLLLRMLKEKRPTQPLIIALDNEAEDDKAARVADKEKELVKGLEELGIPYLRRNPCGEYHDANEALVKDRKALTAEIIAAYDAVKAEAEEQERKLREAYLSTSAGAHLQDFLNGITESANTDAIPTGFPLLDRTLDGGLYEGLVTVGGISSLGKTSLIMQVADQVASAGYDVLIFSLEMSRTQLMSKSISRHTIQLAKAQGIDPRNAKTSRGITTGKRYSNYNSTELKLIQDATIAYSEYADRIFIQEGVGDITVETLRETVEKHILLTGGKWEENEETGERRLTGGRRPLVVVDYLQIIAPHSDRATDKQVVDHAVLELKRISRDYKLPVIAISSFNRGGYKIEATFEQLKESGAIEYSSDIVLALQLRGAGGKNFDPTTAKRKNPREIELVVLKNRDGAVGGKVAYDYYPMFNLFEEAGVS